MIEEMGELVPVVKSDNVGQNRSRNLSEWCKYFSISNICLSFFILFYFFLHAVITGIVIEWLYNTPLGCQLVRPPSWCLQIAFLLPSYSSLEKSSINLDFINSSLSIRLCYYYFVLVGHIVLC